MNKPSRTSTALSGIAVILRLSFFVFLVFLFLVAVKLFGSSVELLGGDFTKTLFTGLRNPFAGLAVGILATAIIQSSSATTSIIVAMVGAGQLELPAAIPMVMGANIGTTITCVIIAFGHVGDKNSFARAFAGSTVHDNFNILTLAVLFPVELVTRQIFGCGLLEGIALYLTGFLVGGSTLASASASSLGSLNPVNATVTPVAKLILAFFKDIPWLTGVWQAVPLMIFSLALLLVSLIFITNNMKVLMSGKAEAWIQKILTEKGYIGLLVGLFLTAIIQSSSITTSLLVPMYAAGILSPMQAFPILIGANIGTTVTGLLASTVTNSPLGITIALAHTMFNVAGMMIFYPMPFMRKIPVGISEWLAKLVMKNRMMAIIYVVVIFFMIPITGIFLWKETPEENLPEPPAVMEQIDPVAQ